MKIIRPGKAELQDKKDKMIKDMDREICEIHEKTNKNIRK